MKSTAFVSIFLLVFLNNASAADVPLGADSAKTPDAEVEVDVSPGKDGSTADVLSAELGNLCFFAGTPPSDFKFAVVKKLKVGKGTYGGVKEILPKFAGYARKHGADAIISYTGSQRFGFWPWRMVRPVVRGTAIKWLSPPTKDCEAMGGSTLSTIMATDQPPAQ